jgi:hypothetical protein
MNWRVPVGFLLAPLAPCGLYATAMSILANQWSGFLSIVVAMTAISEALSLLVAAPLYFLLRRFRPIGVLECVISGVAITVLLNVILLIFVGGPGSSAGDGGGPTIVDGHPTGHGLLSALVGTAVQSMLGATIGLCFWVIAVRPVRYR